jgi:hypothetical protein
MASHPPPSRGKSVTHVSGTFCYLCLGPLTKELAVLLASGDSMLVTIELVALSLLRYVGLKLFLADCPLSPDIYH